MTNMKTFFWILFLAHGALADSFFYVLSKEGKCSWELWNPLTNTNQVLTNFSSECPRNVFFNSSNKKFYYVQDKKLFARPWSDCNKVESWALPQDAKDLEDGKILRDYTTNKIRYAIFDTDPKRVKTVRKPKDSETYSVSYKQKAVGEVYGLGEVGAAILFELNADGKWKMIEARATNWGACDTQGLSVLNMQSSPIDDPPQAEASKFQCTGEPDCIKNLTPDIQEAIKAQFKEEPVYILKLAKGWTLVGKPVSGETYFFPGPPIFLFSPFSKKLAPLQKSEGQSSYEITLSASSEWFTLGPGPVTSMGVMRDARLIYRFDNPEPVRAIEGGVSTEMWLRE
jgi:hypothetical protein